MRAEQVSIAKRWRRPRSEFIRRAWSDAVQAAEKRSRTAARLDAADADFSMRVHRRARLIPPRQSIWSVAALATALAFFSASLDIVIDAYRRELLKDHEQGLGTAI